MLEKEITAQINKNPDSKDVINDYGFATIKVLSEVATKMIDVQKDFDSQVNVMTTSMDKLLNIFESDQNHTASLTDIFNSFQALENNLGKVLADAKELDKECATVNDEISEYLAVGEKIKKRYAEEYLPKAQKAFNETEDSSNKDYLEKIINCQKDFSDRLLVLEASRLNGDNAANQLSQIINVINDQIGKVENLIENIDENKKKREKVSKLTAKRKPDSPKS